MVPFGAADVAGAGVTTAKNVDLVADCSVAAMAVSGPTADVVCTGSITEASVLVCSVAGIVLYPNADVVCS